MASNEPMLSSLKRSFTTDGAISIRPHLRQPSLNMYST
jgi:hypothetical protein